MFLPSRLRLHCSPRGAKRNPASAFICSAPSRISPARDPGYGRAMTIKGKAYIAGAYEHPTRHAPDKTCGATACRGGARRARRCGAPPRRCRRLFLRRRCARSRPGHHGRVHEPDKLRHVDSTELGGTSYVALAAHAAEAIALGKCNVALITLAGRPRSEGMATGTAPRLRDPNQPEAAWEFPYGLTTANGYAMCAMRHMHQYGTTGEQLAWIKVAASHHAQYNPTRHAAGGRHGRGRREFAGDRRSAAPARLLRHQRRRRRARGGPAGNRQEA